MTWEALTAETVADNSDRLRVNAEHATERQNSTYRKSSPKSCVQLGKVAVSFVHMHHSSLWKTYRGSDDQMAEPPSRRALRSYLLSGYRTVINCNSVSDVL